MKKKTPADRIDRFLQPAEHIQIIKPTTDPKIEARRRKLMAERDAAVAARDWPRMNEITKRLAKLPVKGER
jgi:hypothetical protein